jgi:hypothetical protein
MKKVRGKAIATGIAAVLLLMASNAFADEIVNFYLVATTNAQPPGPTLPGVSDASGTITIDTTTGVIDAIDLSFANTTDPTYPPTQPPIPGAQLRIISSGSARCGSLSPATAFTPSKYGFR